MMDLSLWAMTCPVIAVLADRVPGIAFGVPLFVVTAGTTLGMMIANVPAVLLGDRAVKFVPIAWVRRVAAVVFAATHHESPQAIGRATIQWIGWLGGILGAVLVAVSLLGWLA